MNILGRWAGLSGILVALVGCSSQASYAPETGSETAIPCEELPARLPLQAATEYERGFDRLNFQPRSMELTGQTVAVVNDRYRYVFCKRDRTWGLLAREASEADAAAGAGQDYDSYLDDLADPPYSTVNLGQKSYQVRVRLDAPWLDEDLQGDGTEPPEDAGQVLFEVIAPGSSRPTTTVVYTTSDIRDRNLGFDLGVPSLSQPVSSGDSLWWGLSFEQGEGNSGIATIVQLDATQGVILHQPETLGSAQFTDIDITGSPEAPTLWLGTQYAGEGNPYLPAHGLVAYQPMDGSLEQYTFENSPLGGTIPRQLAVDGERLWVAMADGVCQLPWAAAADYDAWDCWQFAVQARVGAGAKLYPSSQAIDPIEELVQDRTLALLWLTGPGEADASAGSSRYEVTYAPGIIVTLETGADYYPPENSADEGWFSWPGQGWYWNGERFTRPFA